MGDLILEGSVEPVTSEIRFSEITPREWARMKRMAKSLKGTGIYGNDSFKLTVAAFAYWISLQEKVFIFEPERSFEAQ